jgi:hypothetical protein
MTENPSLLSTLKKNLGVRRECSCCCGCDEEGKKAATENFIFALAKNFLSGINAKATLTIFGTRRNIF